MGGFSSYGSKPSLILLSLQLLYRTPEMLCFVRWALLLFALLELADVRTCRAYLSWSVLEMHSFFVCMLLEGLVGETPALADWPHVGLLA
jgi:hypothetical protein